MEAIHFIKTNPTQNMTLLVATPVPVEQQFALAERLMAYENVHGEQVGFIMETTHPAAKGRLRMMAGEFCGNATLSLGAWLLWKEGMAVGEVASFSLEVSGTTALVPCTFTRREQDFFGTVTMPLAERVEERRFSFQGETHTLPVVVFPGITHVILPKAQWIDKAEAAALAWAGELPEVFGLLLWDSKTRALTPLVSVQNASMIWERGCGSGTAAIGVYEGLRTGKNVSLGVKEPGGIMEVSVQVEAGIVTKIQVSGGITIVAEGTAYLQ